MSSPARTDTSLREIAGLFLRLGTTAFGGPAAHIALIRHEVVERRRWLTEERFLDLLGAANLIPGPTSTELAIHIGWERRRWSGLWVAGLSFIVPAMLMTAILGWLYVRYGSVPEVAWLLYGVKPVVPAIVLHASWRLARTAARTWPLRILGAAAAAACVLGANELAVLFGAGALAAVVRSPREGGARDLRSFLPFLPAAGEAAAAGSVTLPGLFWVFLKIGSVLFGSGYVLLAFLRPELVERLEWLTEEQLVDAIAVGQVTPGPLFTTATFIGYVLSGPWGALVATAGIFLPAFVFVALSGPWIPRLRASRLAGGFLDGVNVASLALMLVVTLELGLSAVVDVPTAAMAGLAAILLFRFETNPSWLVLLGAAAGGIVHWIGRTG